MKISQEDAGSALQPKHSQKPQTCQLLSNSGKTLEEDCQGRDLIQLFQPCPGWTGLMKNRSRILNQLSLI